MPIAANCLATAREDLPQGSRRTRHPVTEVLPGTLSKHLFLVKSWGRHPERGDPSGFPECSREAWAMDCQTWVSGGGGHPLPERRWSGVSAPPARGGTPRPLFLSDSAISSANERHPGSKASDLLHHPGTGARPPGRAGVVPSRRTRSPRSAGYAAPAAIARPTGMRHGSIHRIGSRPVENDEAPAALIAAGASSC